MTELGTLPPLLAGSPNVGLRWEQTFAGMHERHRGMATLGPVAEFPVLAIDPHKADAFRWQRG